MSRALSDQVSLPRVTVVIINWNYARYLPQTLRSVLAQDYPGLSCLFVDNGSDDGSFEIASDLVGHDPRFHLLRLDRNYGQLGALFKVFGEVEGDFVVLLDADDMLDPAFISSHVQVHLALPKAVAFTSANVIEIDAEQRAKTGGYQSLGSPLPWNSPALAPASRAIRVPTISDDDFAELSTRSSAIPVWHTGWFWSPGSANMYRRSILRLVMQARADGVYKRAADAYLNPLCHALGGSALIDIPLSFYRIHDDNYFSLREALAGLHTGRPEFEHLHASLTEETVDYLFSESAKFRALLGGERFWNVPEQVAYTLTGKSPYRSAAFASSAARHLRALLDAIGEHALLRELPPRLRRRDAAPMLRAAIEQRLPRTLAFRLARAIARLDNAPWLPRGFLHHPPPPRGYSPTPRNFGPVAVLSADPPLIKTGIAYDEWIGIAGAFGHRFGNVPAGFLIYPTWSIEPVEKIAAIANAAREHVRRYPDHRLVYMANTQREADLLAGRGLTAIFLNKNFTVSERIFRPLDDVTPDFDAIYSARFVPEKRHELARAIQSLAYLGYLDGTDEQMREQTDFLAALRRAAPHHALLNPIEDGRLRRLDHDATNRALNRARIGLCLSETEGSNYASIEYMLAGLGVVSTPSQGGRDVYFDEEFCLVCEPSPEAVKAAVTELKARQIPREHIRARTLERVRKQRERFLNLLDDLREQLGAPRQNIAEWPYHEVSGLVTWDSFDGHLQRMGRGNSIAEIQAITTAFDEAFNGAPAGMQLEPLELMPIIRAVLAVPGCRLLVFGIGNDSPMWERLNAGGRTVFVEDDQSWIDRISPQLSGASVCKVVYGTRVADWPGAIDDGDRLVLDLPDDIMHEDWDVILVDAPPGQRDDLPGRARSIVTAARLVAPGGTVFVHDCERPLERAFAARYLGEHRRVQSVRGRALLNRYAF